ncbi:ATP-binding protein [Kitasatospora sp. NPDC004723]|uniref:ATP-binding protein n=1 Tax=Kitasatospora sp. NPDC004723 TaxID=3154288 RepID=UPI0033BBAD04
MGPQQRLRAVNWNCARGAGLLGRFRAPGHRPPPATPEPAAAHPPELPPPPPGAPMPQHGPLYRLTLTATASDPHQRVACVGPARQVVRSVATGWGLDGTVLDDLVAVASELLANAARHAGPARLTALLRLAAAGDRVRFEVEDQGAALPRIVAGLGDDQAVTGRGLLMVEALAEEWGSTPTGTGKVVWAELALPAPLDLPAIAAQARQAAARSDYMRAASMGTAPRRIPIVPTARRAR